MGETKYEIESHIVKTRDDLGANLHELEKKVKDITDWRYHYQNHPMALMGVAFGGGILLATMMGKSRSAPTSMSSSVSSIRPVKNKAVQTWDHIKDALLGVAATKSTDFVGEVVPGFTKEFRSRAKATYRAGTSELTQ